MSVGKDGQSLLLTAALPATKYGATSTASGGAEIQAKASCDGRAPEKAEQATQELVSAQSLGSKGKGAGKDQNGGKGARGEKRAKFIQSKIQSRQAEKDWKRGGSSSWSDSAGSGKRNKY